MPAEVSCVYELRRCAGLGWARLGWAGLAGNYYHIQLTQLPLCGPQSSVLRQHTEHFSLTRHGAVSGVS